VGGRSGSSGDCSLQTINTAMLAVVAAMATIKSRISIGRSIVITKLASSARTELPGKI
jgi:hypothetical protein